jgi:hypothetical protein
MANLDCESRSSTHENNVGFGFNALPLSAPGFDFSDTVQDFLPHIACDLEFGEGLTD